MKNGLDGVLLFVVYLYPKGVRKFMDQYVFAGILLRMLRLQRNWSQETLCRGICAVSYLSKIEQGKVEANEALLRDLFAKLDVAWQTIPEEEGAKICEELYDVIFSGDSRELERIKEDGELRQDGFAMGIRYLDYLVLRAYCYNEMDLLPEQLRPQLNSRQRCLLLLLQGDTRQAYSCFPCALTAKVAGVQAYTEGNYAMALELLQSAYDLACQEGFVYIMQDCQIYIANCYSDLRDIPNMRIHCKIAKRLANSLGEEEIIRTIDYNMASTQMECGEFEAAYLYFSALPKPSALDLHKLAICCEKLGKFDEATTALDSADRLAGDLERQMCALVRCRLDKPDYLKDAAYGKLLLEIFAFLRKEMPIGFARFHLPWVEEWCVANRQYRLAYEIMRDFLE